MKKRDECPNVLESFFRTRFSWCLVSLYPILLSIKMSLICKSPSFMTSAFATCNFNLVSPLKYSIRSLNISRTSSHFRELEGLTSLEGESLIHEVDSGSLETAASVRNFRQNFLECTNQYAVLGCLWTHFETNYLPLLSRNIKKVAHFGKWRSNNGPDKRLEASEFQKTVPLLPRKKEELKNNTQNEWKQIMTLKKTNKGITKT
ncbi:hypothetical protein Ahy_B08g094403 isoform A [Arachis hypogaea]|uniref:Uncharacterized protein n=1 Tax=Arachis hypogaea TaxID=3818 RepID=A0A444Y8W6_ARAHY|nr:hypothetical protein Ahy_B08g094403 isoform A [Arachis hypogaea]